MIQNYLKTLLIFKFFINKNIRSGESPQIITFDKINISLDNYIIK